MSNGSELLSNSSCDLIVLSVFVDNEAQYRSSVEDCSVGRRNWKIRPQLFQLGLKTTQRCGLRRTYKMSLGTVMRWSPGSGVGLFRFENGRDQ